MDDEDDLATIGQRLAQLGGDSGPPFGSIRWRRDDDNDDAANYDSFGAKINIRRNLLIS